MIVNTAISPEDAGGESVCMFLETVAHSEGTSASPITQNFGYDVIVTGINGPSVFTDYSDHPNVLVEVNASLYSTAAGRYQLLHKYWVAYKAQLSLPDFSPVSQDKVAIQQIRERKAITLIQSGNIKEAIVACSNIWASFPGAGYGQHENSMQKLLDFYNS